MSELLVGEVRFSYLNVFAPYAANGGDPKYSVTLLILKSNVTLVQQINVAIEQAKQEGVAKRFGGTMPNFVASPLHDGDGAKQTGEPYGEECQGHYVMTASCKPEFGAPGVVVAQTGQNPRPALDQSEVYSGCYGYALVNFVAYNASGKKGVGCYLQHVMKTRDGEAFAGTRTRLEDAFAGVTVPVPVQGQPVAAPGVVTQPGYTASMPNPYGQPVAPAVTPGYPQQAAPAQPQYTQAPQQAPVQAQYPQQTPVQPAVPQQFDPITGQPIVSGGVMGI